MEVAFTISPGERQHVEYLADLFAVIVAIEKIEKAMLRDLITQQQYDTTIHRLLEKYKSTVSHLEQGSNPYYTTIDSFWENYGSKCPAARTRIQLGFEGAKQQQQEQQQAGRVNPRLVLECGQYFITLMDSLKLQQTAVDQLYTLLTDLIQGLKRLNVEEQDFFQRLLMWKKKLDTMNASDELNEKDTREFAFVLERGYQAFHGYLSETSGSVVSRS
ncbi:vacuolar protein sorting-associated protein-like [Trypanosoma theileri]|uniref:Vacuolar protein sorting-associated protein 28 homolog n=1 Tax=Trypanosoma theileri TaxID=67003 RepID=A0A1X0P3A4_9TRYP|nr:vacuolar protein sorting-associated protein-like [Trypanosoma theileri]ORC91331.1 vacuolar protein sorting-associated protein-like [Trypanosoma theileri]